MGLPFVIAGDDSDSTSNFDSNLSGTEKMPGGMKGHPSVP
jgi:hypothetical protein